VGSPGCRRFINATFLLLKAHTRQSNAKKTLGTETAISRQPAILDVRRKHVRQGSKEGNRVGLE
jgi:hypothetical protein